MILQSTALGPGRRTSLNPGSGHVAGHDMPADERTDLVDRLTCLGLDFGEMGRSRAGEEGPRVNTTGGPDWNTANHNSQIAPGARER